jgi:DNA-binding SARP family transcriptional activator/WD40 repeat protein
MTFSLTDRRPGDLPGTPHRVAGRYRAGLPVGIRAVSLSLTPVMGAAHSRRMALSLLGPLLVDGSGRLSRRDRVVLSALAVRSGDVLSAEQLADALWGDDLPASWQKVVQGCVARLRRVIGRGAVQTTSGGYRLTLADDEIDLRRFEHLLGRARELAGRGEHDRAAALLTQALALWRGSPLGDVDGWPAGHTEAGRLEELRLTAQESLLVERAALGEDVVADASALVAAQPLRETRWHLLAVALYRAGRQSDALAALRGARRALQDELGLDPSQELVELERAILHHDPDLAAPPRAVRDTGVCPYQGLRVYDRADASRFFGRDQEAVACLRILRDCSLLVVAGPSGCGKSSLVRAGVVPRVERSGGKVRLITPGAQPLEALAGALATPIRDLVLVVDQLEELFTAHGPLVSTGFLEQVAAMAESGHAVVLVVRADQLGGFTRSPTAARLVEQGLHLVTPLTRDELHEAIDGPARQAGLRLEPGLVELLVHQVENEPGALPLLSHALAETWVRREAGVLTVAGYRATGEIQGAVAQSAEAMWESQPVPARAEIRALLLRLVALSSDGEPAAARVSLASVTGAPARERALDLLTRCRLVTTDEKTVTLAHEALARAWPRLRSWLDEDAAGHRLLRHLTVAAEDWQTRDRPDSELYRGARLSAAVAWRRSTTPSLTALEADFLDASQALAAGEQHAARARARRQRVALATTALGLVLALVAGLVAVQQSRQSARTARTALVDQLVAQSVALRSTRRDLATLLAVQAYRLRPSSATRGALLGVFTATPGFLGFTPTGTTAGDRVPLAAGTYLPDGHTLLAVGTDGIAREIDPATGSTVGRFPPPALTPVNARLDLSRDGHTLAVVSWEGPEPSGGRSTLAVYDTANRRRRLPDTRLPLDVGAVAVSPTGRYVAVSGYVDGRVLIFDTQGRTRLPVLLDVYQRTPGVRRLGPYGAAPDPVGTVRHTAALMFRPDGQLLTGSTSGVLRLVDPATGRETRRFTGAPGLTSNNTFTSALDGRALLSTGTAGVVRWDPATGRPLWSALIGEDRCGQAAVVGELVLCAGRFGQVESLDLRTGSSTTARYDMQHGSVSDVVVSPDGRTLLELADTQPVLARWRLDGTGPITRLLPVIGAPTGYDASGRFLVVSGPSDVIDAEGDPHPVQRVVDSRTGAVVYRSDIVLHAPVWTGRAGKLAGWDSDDQGHVVDVRSGRAVLELFSGLGGSDGTYMSAGGLRLLAWVNSYAWGVWDLRTGDELFSGSSPGTSGSADRSGQLVVWSDGSKLWTVRVSDGHVVARRGGLSAGAVSPDGVVAASRMDGSLTFLDERTLRPDGRALSDAPGTIEQFAFSGDGSLLAARGSDGNVRLIDMTNRAQVGGPIVVNGEGDRTIAFRRDGRALAEPSRNGVLIWDLRPATWVIAACQLAGRELSRQEWQTYLAASGDYQRTCPKAADADSRRP